MTNDQCLNKMIRKLFKKIYSKENHKYFTLIELLVVISIISLLAGLIIVNVNSARLKARDSQRKGDLDKVQLAVEGWSSKNGGKYPITFTAGETEVFLNSLDNPTDWVPNPALPLPPFVPDYISVLPKDPGSSSGNPQYIYSYASDGINYKLEVVVMESDQGKKWASEDGGIDNNKYELFSGGGLSWVGPAKAQSRIALRFDGIDDYVQINDSSSSNVSRITMAAWVYVYPFPQGDVDPMTYYHILNKLGDSSSYTLSSYSMAITHRELGGQESNQFVPFVRYGTYSGIQKACDCQIPENKWTHLAATYDGSQLLIYVNGVLTASMSRAGAVIPTTGNLLIGSKNPLRPSPPYETSLFFNGKIDDVRIYNTALPQVAIQQIMQDAENYLEVLHLRFDEGSGSFVQDSSGNNNNGQIFGAQW